MHYPTFSLALSIPATFATATISATLLAKFGFPLPPLQQRIGCLDGLRGYLALAVLVHHFVIWLQITSLGGTWFMPSIPFFEQLGAMSVALFFMITGAVFYPKIRRGFYNLNWPAFILTRLCRIVPLTVLSISAVTIIIMLRTGHQPDGIYISEAFTWLTGQSEPDLLNYPNSGWINAYVLWSIWFEWLFYFLILPICALISSHRGRNGSWIIPALLFLLTVPAHHLLGQFRLWGYLPYFAIGMFASECQSHPGLATSFRTRPISVAATAGLLIGMTLFFTPYGFAMLLGGFFLVCVACGNNLYGLLQLRGALVLGECSFGIYLLHGVLLNVMFVSGRSVIMMLPIWLLPAFLPIAGFVIVFISGITYLLIERPANQFGHTFAKRWMRQNRATATLT